MLIFCPVSLCARLCGCVRSCIQCPSVSVSLNDDRFAGVYLWCDVAQVECVLHGFLTPLVIGCSSQVTSVEATSSVVSIGGSVENMHATGENGKLT